MLMKFIFCVIAVFFLGGERGVEGFGNFQPPKMPWDKRATNTGDGAALKPGDRIAVIGASGNVGKLVALRLSDTYKVNGILRDAESVQSFLGGDRDNKIDLFEVDLLEEISNTEGTAAGKTLETALSNANAIVICTGTTAFPTKAWSNLGDRGIAGDVVSALIKSKFNVKDAIAVLDDKGLNTPNNIDAKANEFIVETWQRVCRVPKKRVILLSSIGVQRRDSMPFPILNACGVLDAKAAGEAAIMEAAKASGFSYTIIRPGQLFGGPYDNNYYLGTLFQLDKDSDTQDVKVGRGDELLGDTLRSTLAEVTAQICETDCARDLDFAVVNVKGPAPTVKTIQSRLMEL